MNQIGVVAWNGQPPLRLRSAPSTGETNVVASLPFNTRVQVIQRFAGDWLLVATLDGKMGFCDRPHVWFESEHKLPEPNARAGPDERTLAEAADRRAAAIAAAEAERARHLDAVFANADRLWEAATRRVNSRSTYDQDAARILLDDLLAAADRHAARAAFELRLAELRAGTAKLRRFWQRWDTLHPAGAAPASPT